MMLQMYPEDNTSITVYSSKRVLPIFDVNKLITYMIHG